MSKGMQQRLGIAQALVGAPPLLLLDEPTSALDPVGRLDRPRATSRVFLKAGISVLLNSHLLSEIELVCDRVVILLHGRVVAEGSPAELGRARGVEIETENGTRLFEGAAHEDAPKLVAERRRGPLAYSARVLTPNLRRRTSKRWAEVYRRGRIPTIVGYGFS